MFHKNRLLVFISSSLTLFLSSCQPALSEVEVELVDTTYIAQLPTTADTFFVVQTGSNEKILGVISSIQYEIGGGQKTLLLHYDPTGKVLAMQEKRYGKSIDSVFFYSNGQRMFKLQLDTEGLADGPAKHYYSDGRIKNDGRYIHGKKTGIWRNFNESGKLISTEEFDKYGTKTR